MTRIERRYRAFQRMKIMMRFWLIGFFLFRFFGDETRNGRINCCNEFDSPEDITSFDTNDRVN